MSGSRLLIEFDDVTDARAAELTASLTDWLSQEISDIRPTADQPKIKLQPNYAVGAQGDPVALHIAVVAGIQLVHPAIDSVVVRIRNSFTKWWTENGEPAVSLSVKPDRKRRLDKSNASKQQELLEQLRATFNELVDQLAEA